MNRIKTIVMEREKFEFIQEMYHPVIDRIVCNYETGNCKVVYKDNSTFELFIGFDGYNTQYGVSVDDEGETVVIGDWYYNVGLRCYKIATGELIWKKKLSKVRTNVMIGNSVVIARGYTSIMSLNKFTGETEMEIKSGTITDMYLLSNNRLLVDSIRGKLSIIDGCSFNLIKKFSDKEVNPRQCWSLVITNAEEENNEIIIHGWEQYPNMEYQDKDENTRFSRKLRL